MDLSISCLFPIGWWVARASRLNRIISWRDGEIGGFKARQLPFLPFMVTTIYQSSTAFKEATNYVDPGNPSLAEAGISYSEDTGIHLSPKAVKKSCWPVSFLVLGNCLRSTFRIHHNTNRFRQASWKSAEEAGGSFWKNVNVVVARTRGVDLY